MRQAQEASDRATQASIEMANQVTQSMQNSLANTPSAAAVTHAPSFSVKKGTVPAGTMVRIKCPTHYAVIYYTTNGWTPTISSRRYTGPITIKASTQLQAIAVAPNMLQSMLAQTSYTVKGPSIPVYPLALANDGVLHAKTRLHMVTNSTVNSKTAAVGDKIDILLDQDIKLGNFVIIPKGTPVDATITIADHSGIIGAPGDIAFEVHSLVLPGVEIPLKGGESLEGVNHVKRSAITFMALGLSVVGTIPAIMMHGGQAEIKPGMTFTVAVAQDTNLLTWNSGQ